MESLNINRTGGDVYMETLNLEEISVRDLNQYLHKTISHNYSMFFITAITK